MHEVLHPSHWKRASGYANGIAATGRQIHVAGQVGWNAQQQFETDDFVMQVDQALKNIVAVLREGSAGPEHIVRLTWYILDKREYLDRLSAVGTVYRTALGRNYPVMTMVQVSALIEDQAKVEIEATAIVPD